MPQGELSLAFCTTSCPPPSLACVELQSLHRNRRWLGETKVVARDPVRDSKTLNGAVAVGKEL